jgi:hypothetical protein
MIWYWLVRLGLVAGAFLLASFGSFLLAMFVTWDQGVLEVVSLSSGAVLAILTFIHTSPRERGSQEVHPVAKQ